MSEEIVTSFDDGVRTIRINRPDKKNALTVAMYEDLVAAFKEAEADKATRCIVVTGEGDMFTAGNDLMDFMNAPAAGENSAVFQFLLTIAAMETPIIGAVNGHGIGIGCTMLLHCDLNYAVEGATLKMPFVPLGLCPEGASSFLLPRMAGMQKAAELLMFGESVPVEEMERIGVINKVLPKDEFAAYVVERAKKLAALPARSLRTTKRLLRAEVKETVSRVLTNEGGEFVQLLPSDEAREAFTAFFEKRKPDFKQFD